MSIETRLCCEILEEEFGPFVSKVSRQLLLKGRLNLPDIVRFSQLRPKQVRECLVVLIQHGLLYFSEPLQDERGPTFYEIVPQRILMRLRIGPIIRYSEEHFGKEGALICKLLLTHGRLTLPTLCQRLTSHTSNGLESYKNAFISMVAGRFLMALLPEHSRSKEDRMLEAEQQETEKHRLASAKELQSAKLAARAQIEAEYSALETIGMKRKAVQHSRTTNKRPAMEVDDVAVREEIEIDEKIFFGINYERYNIEFRNHVVADYAVERINHTAGQIIRAFFTCGKDKIRSLQEDDTPSTSPVHVANVLSKQDVNRDDIVLSPSTVPSSRKPTLGDIVNAYITLLETDQAGFVKRKDERGANQFSVDFAKLRESMKRRLLETLLREQYGVATYRIVRILLDKGKLDESQVQKLAMLPIKDTREKLGLLNTKGIVEIQEVPRTADRAPGRSFYLWYVPLDKCYRELLVDVYRAIGNLQRRKQQELKIRARLLEKMSRKDVQENMDLLSEADKNERVTMEKVLERIEIAKRRLDGMVLVLRDI